MFFQLSKKLHKTVVSHICNLPSATKPGKPKLHILISNETITEIFGSSLPFLYLEQSC